MTLATTAKNIIVQSSHQGERSPSDRVTTEIRNRYYVVVDKDASGFKFVINSSQALLVIQQRIIQEQSRIP